jgi:hypothetical protein
VPEHEQLDVFHVQAAPATNERAQQSPDGEIEEGESHATEILPTRSPRACDIDIGALQAWRMRSCRKRYASSREARPVGLNEVASDSAVSRGVSFVSSGAIA